MGEEVKNPCKEIIIKASSFKGFLLTWKKKHKEKIKFRQIVNLPMPKGLPGTSSRVPLPPKLCRVRIGNSRVAPAPPVEACPKKKENKIY